MGKKIGAPTKYKEEYIDKVDEYLLECRDYEYDNKLKVNLPTIGGFALFIGVPERTIYDWKDVHEDFSQSLERIVKEQEKRLINSGLSGDYNSTIAKLILSSNHGMAEKSETDHTSGGKTIKGVSVILDKAYGIDTDKEE